MTHPSFPHRKRLWSWWTVLPIVVLAATTIAVRRANNKSPLDGGVMVDSELPLVRYELVESEEGPKLLRYAAQERRVDGSYENVTVHRWMSLLTRSNHSQDLIAQFNAVLVQASESLRAFVLETKGVHYGNAQTKTFEFVLVESAALFHFADAQQDASDFGDKLECGNPVGCVFHNLGGDSTLIAPARAEGTGDDVYGHLAAFLRRAPATQVLPFWKLAIETVLETLQQNPKQSFWFSTEGTGVKWLHMRVDPRPKYYHYRPFANEK